MSYTHRAQVNGKEADRIIELYKQGYSYKDMEKILERSHQTIAKVLHEYKVLETRGRKLLGNYPSHNRPRVKEKSIEEPIQPKEQELSNVIAKFDNLAKPDIKQFTEKCNTKNFDYNIKTLLNDLHALILHNEFVLAKRLIDFYEVSVHDNN